MSFATDNLCHRFKHHGLPKGVPDIIKVNSLSFSGITFFPSTYQTRYRLLAKSSARRESHFTRGASHFNPQKTLLHRAPAWSFSGVCQVKSGDSEGSLSGESIMLNQEILEREMQIAIAEENYVKAAKIRDSLHNLREDRKAAVLAANRQFYDAFKNGDLSAMQALWLKEDNICCVHPGALGISGYESVIDSWNHLLANYEFPLDIELQEIRVHVREDIGYVTCVELIKTKGSSWGAQFVTNVFQKVDGKWFICIHHASHFDF